MMLRPQDPDMSSPIGLVIGNLAEIAGVFGEGVAVRVMVELARRVEDIAGLAPEDVTIGRDGVYFPALPEAVAAMMSAVAGPVCVGDAHVVMALALPWSGVRQFPPGVASYSQIVDDMSVAAALYGGIRDGGYGLVIQPVCRSPLSLSSCNDDILYWECLSRVVDVSGCSISPAAFIGALERSGLTRCFDAHVVSSALDLLERNDGMSLGCNISAQSTFDDEWWSGIFARLRKKPGLASRLVIEITESSPVLKVSDYIRFVEHLRSLGCRIALDDFGKGFHSIDLARKCPPDIIKIDASFLPRGEGEKAEKAVRLFRHLIALANNLAPAVVVEGVEDADDRVIALKGGASWMQGYYLAKPAPLTSTPSGADQWGLR